LSQDGKDRNPGYIVALSKIKIGGIIQNSRLARIRLTGHKDSTYLAAELLEALGKANINVEFIVQSANLDHVHSLVVCVDQDDQKQALDILNYLNPAREIDALDIDPEVTSIGIYGPDFRVKAGLAASVLKSLHARGISLQAISTSLSTFTVLIPSSQTHQALAAIHENFELP
jgi:aspartate kinase